MRMHTYTIVANRGGSVCQLRRQALQRCRVEADAYNLSAADMACALEASAPPT